jgi:hypothetical protein
MSDESQQAVKNALAESKQSESSVGSSGATPGESPYYNRVMWASYKGQSRGQWGGVLLGGGLGATAGVAVAAVTALAVGTAFSAVVLPVVAVSAMGGMLYGKEVFGLSGAVAGAVSAGMEIAEERRHAEEQGKGQAQGQGAVATAATAKAVQVAAPTTTTMSDYTKVGHMASGEIAYTGNEEVKLFGDKHHDIDERPIYFGKVGAAGAAIGAAFAGAVAYAGGGLMDALEHTESFKHLLDAMNISGGAVAATGVAQTMVTASGAAVGATYGINRHYFRNVFNVSNALYDGQIDEIGKQMAQQQSVEQARVQNNVEASHASEPLPAAVAVAAQPVKESMPVMNEQAKAAPRNIAVAILSDAPTTHVEAKHAVLSDAQIKNAISPLSSQAL